MSVHNSLEYRRSLKEAEKIRDFLKKLDNIGDILYDNLEFRGVWELLDKFEDLRMKYYMIHHEHETVVKKRGKTNG